MTMASGKTLMVANATIVYWNISYDCGCVDCSAVLVRKCCC
jgi:hypothetical protein